MTDLHKGHDIYELNKLSEFIQTMHICRLERVMGTTSRLEVEN